METYETAKVTLPGEVLNALERAKAAAAAAAGGNIFSAFVVFRDPLPGGTTLTLTITGIPAYVTVALGFLSEESGGKSHAGGAIFYTNSVQLGSFDHTVRCIGSHNWGSALHVGVQLLLGW
jgi:hypothetical protein